MSAGATIAIVAAVAKNAVIGRNGDMPWHLPTDLKRFKALTLGHPVIMGRRTFESIGKPLPGRLNIVVTRDHDWEAQGAMAVRSLGAAVELASAHLESFEPDPDDPDAEAPDTIFIAGGGEIYAQAIDMADVLHITHVDSDVAGDTHFPKVAYEDWRVIRADDVPAGEKDSHATRYVVYERRSQTDRDPPPSPRQ
ncbi:MULTISPECIES: dihydrofolate reductase [unclassified Roseitalea]|uniref:dihydrofolate reductase n=1 Tax=unclassified Roseitalea TaxID=2639107 RepID=UPI00273E94F4|nr:MULTISPECIES: dihydrofolate reductase [unclassified Roseitalea]